MKIAALYARVSTERQEKEETIESQIAEIKEQIKEDGNVLGKDLVFVDDGWSGATIVRPQLDVLRDATLKKEFEALYVYDRGRLARKFAYQEIIIEELEKNGIEFVTLHDVKAKTPEEKVLQGMQGLFHEYERIKITERMRRGKLYKARSGKIVHGPAPYGYRYIHKIKDKEGYYVICKEEARVVRMIFHWVGDKCFSIQEVIKKLQELGIKPRKSKREVWGNSTLSRMLKNETYIGTTYYNKGYAVEPERPFKNEKYKKIKKSSRRLRAKGEWIGISVPVIIGKDLFYRVQKRVKKNTWFNKKNQKYNYLLSGLVFCGCGSRMCGEGSGRGHRYYRCSNRIKRYPLPKNCFTGGVNTKRIDSVVCQKVKELLTSPDLIKKQAERWLAKKELNKISYREVEIEKLEKELRLLMKEEKRQAKAYGAGLLSFATFRELMTDLKMKRETLKYQLQEIKTKRLKTKKVPPMTVEETCQCIPLALEEVFKEEKQVILRTLIEKIIVDKERAYATIKGYIPFYLTKESNKNVEFETISRDCRIAECGEIDLV